MNGTSTAVYNSTHAWNSPKARACVHRLEAARAARLQKQKHAWQAFPELAPRDFRYVGHVAVN